MNNIEKRWFRFVQFKKIFNHPIEIRLIVCAKTEERLRYKKCYF